MRDIELGRQDSYRRVTRRGANGFSWDALTPKKRNEVKAGKGADARQQNEGRLGGPGRGDIGRRNVSDDRKREFGDGTNPSSKAASR